MPNGKPGDHPLTDIVIHRQAVYSDHADALVRAIVEFGGRETIADIVLLEYTDRDTVDIAALERALADIHARLARAPRGRD